MKAIVVLGILASLTMLTRSDDESDVIRLSKLWNVEKHQGESDNGPFKKCVKEFKDCVIGGEGALADEQSCRTKFCSCRKNKCEDYFQSCGSNPWCSLKDICSKAFEACRLEPKKESKCRRSLVRCLKESLHDMNKTNECMIDLKSCLS